MALDQELEKGKGLPTPIIVGIALVIVAAVVFIILGQRQKFELVAPGSKAIDFTLPDLSGKPVKLTDYKGKVVFLNFWATWCKPCEEEMPSMQALYESLKGQPFEILAVSIDSDPPEKVGMFVAKYGITFPVLHDRSGRIKEIYKTTGVPETFIVDQNGIVAEKVWGPRNWGNPASITTIKDLLQNGPREATAYRKGKD